MNSEASKEHQKMLLRERQQRYRKRYSGKENITLQSTKRTKRTTEIISLQIPKARIYPWISFGLNRHSLGNMNYRCSNCGAMMWLNERINKSVNPPKFTTCCANGKVMLLLLQELPIP